MSPRPVVHATTEILYESLGSGFTRDDESTDWHLLKYVDVPGAQLGRIDDIVRDSDAGPGWSSVYDVDEVDTANLAFLAQHVGVVLPGEATEQERRDWIKAKPGWERGTRAAMTEQVQLELVGANPPVYIVERTQGNAYTMTVQVRPADLGPGGLDAVKAAVKRQKPAGLVEKVVSSAKLTYDSLDQLHASYDDMKAAYGTYANMRDAAA